MPLTLLIAPSGFKEGLSAAAVAEHMAAAARRVLPDARLLKAPVVDGGEGFTDALLEACGGRAVKVRVSGPLGEPLVAAFGLLARRDEAEPLTAVVELAAAAGLRLVPRERRNPMLTSSRGVGELMRAALDAGAGRILLGCGDSGVNDGGAGMVQALGGRLLDAGGHELGPGGGALARLARIDLAGLDPRLAATQLDAAVNWHNVLLGERGVARVFAPTKGATPEQVLQLEQALENYARCVQAATGLDIAHAPGSGASGGLGTGFAALLGGTLCPRYEVVLRHLPLDAMLDQADLVLTGEGRLDGQTPYGKVPAEVARRAKLRGLPVIVLAGGLGPDAPVTLDAGIDAYTSIARGPCTLDEAMAQAGPWLEASTEDALRLLQVGMRLPKRRVRSCE